MDFDLDQTDALLATTRSVRKRLDLTRPVPTQVLLDCVRLAVQAPTGGNAQTWRWLIVDDAETKAALAELYARSGRGYLASYQRDALDGQTNRVLDSADFLLEILDRVPAMVIPCVRGRLADTSPIIASSMYGSIVPAVWSFQLALHAHGLGSALTTAHQLRQADVAAILGLPLDWFQVALIPVAYTTGGDFRPSPRRPVDEVIVWNRYGPG